MKRLTMTIATVMAMIALLPEYSDAMASNYHRRHGGGGGRQFRILGRDKRGTRRPRPRVGPRAGELSALGEWSQHGRRSSGGKVVCHEEARDAAEAI
jgi:hypothetical protein